ncbi:hypothetical protein PUNSTDRAFT_131428 [Punctularia strigosozonata HHB-11173 SS5]|uniref:uncharacterized protein n=1 Tax=Punctularia strigosozonata (strain HHB-11173) TaxID=741275 RepID=UPI00044176B9|nr:uncharacterized protein PUNSTDRAFT_131428 [Punctularia strigosozonata HHB-11173 SS5]EIN11258.1 hypothetical protein PUNSTDRAFT_131428 [Punctularia strigosozonata HHB-11173 SS5]
MAAAEVYAQQLYRLGHGLSAWEPEHEVQIGDVGFIQDGRFIKLFNATRAENDPCQRLGVPPYFTPLDLPAHLRDDPYKYFDPMVLHTRSVKNVQVDIDSSNASLIPFGAGFRFECCNDLGAVLVLKQKAMRQNLRDSRVVRQYIRDNVDSWYEFANDLGFRVSEGDIFMVRGCDKTSEWAVAAFAERSADAGISFNGGYVVDAGVRVAVTGSWGWFCSAEHRSGPETAKDPAEFDQTVFIRVWKFRRFPFRIPTRISAAAEPRDGFFDGSDGDCSADWGSDGSSPSSEVAIKLDPSTIKAKHPLDFLLHHMFESGTVSFAIATDDDLYSLFNEVPPLNELPSMLNSQNIGVHVDVQGGRSHEDELCDQPYAFRSGKHP